MFYLIRRRLIILPEQLNFCLEKLQVFDNNQPVSESIQTIRKRSFSTFSELSEEVYEVYGVYDEYEERYDEYGNRYQDYNLDSKA